MSRFYVVAEQVEKKKSLLMWHCRSATDRQPSVPQKRMKTDQLYAAAA
jgi:hypothetical protein